MRRPPRRPTESIFAGGLWQQALIVGLVMAGVTLAVQAIALSNGWPWQTMVFTTLALLQLGNALAIRSERQSILHLGWRSNVPLALSIVGAALVQAALIYVPFLQPVFVTEALDPLQLGVVLVASITGFVAVELDKLVRRRLAARR
jgi:Ca2+-transporting ATPase